MNDLKLRVGRIPFANVFPIFYTLEKEFDCSSYEFIEGVPSRLNSMLREGTVDLSPSSAVEYLRKPSLYGYVDNVSISSKGPVGSIFLFSKKPIELLDGTAICVTSQSATSVALLEVILREFYKSRCSFSVLDKPETSDAGAFLLIGDEALKYNSLVKTRISSPDFLIYDLGEIWYQKTGLPFVFALWIVRSELYNPCDSRHGLFTKFVSDLMRAKEISLKNLTEIASHSPMKAFLTEDEIIAYWNKLDYELDDDHKRGLCLFKDYLK